MTAADLEQKTFSYSLALSGSNNDYAGKTIVVEDTLPDGMEYVPNSVEGTANYIALSGIQATQVGQTLTFTFVSTEKFENQYDSLLEAKVNLQTRHRNWQTAQRKKSH